MSADSTRPEGQTPDDDPQSRVLLWTLISLAGVAVAWWLFFDDLAAGVKSWVGRRHIPDVVRYAEAEDWINAARSLNDATRWAPDDPEVIRTAVMFVEQTGSEPRSMIRFLSKLDEEGVMTPEELSKLGKAYVGLPDLKQAHATHDRFKGDEAQKRPALELLSAIQKAEGLAARSFLTQRQALIADGDNPQSVLDLALLDARSGDPSLSGPARERLWPIARSGGEQATPAIEFLAQHRLLTAPEAADLLQLVESLKKDAKAENTRFAVLSAIIRLHPHQRDQIVNEEIRRWDGRPAANLPPLMAWLVKEQQYERVVRMISDKTAASYTSLLPHYVNALRGLGRWGPLKALLTGRVDAAFPGAQLRIWQAEVESHLSNDPTTPRHLLTTVFDQTGRGEHIVAALQAAEMAELLGYWDLSRRFYEGVAARHIGASMNMYLKAYEMAQKETNGDAMLRTSQQLMKLKPTDLVYLDRANYLRLILGTDIELAIKTLDEAAALPAHRITPDRLVALSFLRALAAYRQGRIDQIAPALAQVKNVDTFPPGARAVFAGLLAISGSASNAYQVAEKVPASLLLPEERRFLARAL